ncbi:MAG: glycosyltransferase 87 family protein [Thermoanaerobaculia bacterium]
MKRRLFAAGAALLLVLGFASATFLAVRQPLSLGDYLAVWGLKARALHASGDLASVFRVDPDGEFSHPEYPPLWPLLLAGTAKLLGRYDELLLTLLRPLLLALAAGLTLARTRAPLPWRLLAAASLTLLPYFQTAAYTGYAEALLVVLVLAALLLVESPSPTPFTPAAAGLLLALAALTKQEGVVALLVVAALLAAARRFRDAAVVAGAGLGLGVFPWALYRAAHGVSGLADFRLDAFGAGKPFRALATFSDLALFTALPWLLGAALLLALAPAARRARRALLAGAAGYALLLVLSFAFARVDVAWLVTWTWDRLVLLPVAALLPALFEAAAEPFASRAE